MTRFGVAILIFITSTGCANPFSTREPEPPEQNTSNFINPSTPEIVFINLRVAIEERNVENYIRSFVDSTRSQRRFTFIPDQGVATTQPGTFTDWDLEDERRYLNQLFQATPTDSTGNLKLDEEIRDEGATTATVTQNYELNVRHTRQSSNIPAVFKGKSQFWLEVNETGDWAIYKWEDYSNAVDASWSELKALFQ